MSYSNLIRSVLKALDILVEVGNNDRGISLRDLALSLNLKTPTAYNLVSTLKSKAFIRRKNMRYVLGPAIFDLVALHKESRLMVEMENAVRSLFVSMNQKATVTFAELTGDEIKTSLKMSPNQPVIIQKSRLQLHPYASATALVVHAFASEEERQALQDRYPFQDFSGPYVNNPGKFDELVKYARKQGYVFLPDLSRDRFAVAAAVLGERRELVGVMGLYRTNIAAEDNEESLKQFALERLLETTNRISKFWVSLNKGNMDAGAHGQ